MRHVAALIVAVATLACAPDTPSPEQAAERYLQALARDPIRTLALVTPGFHDRHGLRFEEVADRPPSDLQARPPKPTPSGDEDLERERARLGWLTVLTKRIFALQSGRFQRRIVSQQTRGNRADVVVRVEGAGRPTLDAHFQLRRSSRDAPWLVDAVLLPELDEAQWIQAFLIAPDAELHRRISEARERRAPPPRTQ